MNLADGAPAQGAPPAPSRPRYLLFSVDTEPDDPQWRGLGDGPWSHENLRGIPELQARLNALGVKATYLITHSVSEQGRLEEALGRELASGTCEAGTHFHPGDTPPFPKPARGREGDGDNILRVPDGMLAEKFARLHSEIASRFGRPTVHRAGAWAMDKRLTALLVAHGYRVDSSVTPGISWKRNGRPDYLGAPMRAYPLGLGDPAEPGDSGILEVPVSIRIPRRWQGTVAGALVGDLLTMPLAARDSLPVRIVRALRPEPPRWLRPAFGKPEGLPGMIRWFEAEGCDYLQVMCHSNELWPGTSPYSRTRADLDIFYANLESILREALSQGYTPVTLSAYAEAHRSAAPAAS